MKFAEMTQEVQIARPNPVILDLGFTPGRRQANKVTAVTRINILQFEDVHVSARV